MPLEGTPRLAGRPLWLPPHAGVTPLLSQREGRHVCRSGQGVRAMLNGGNPGRQVRRGRTSIVLLAAVGLLAVLSPLVVAAARASAATPTITVTTSYDGGAIGGEPIGFNASGFPPNTTFPYTITVNDIPPPATPPTPCTGFLATDASGDASIIDACGVSFLEAPSETITVTYDGVTVTQPPPPQPPAPPTPTVTTPMVSPSTTNVGGSVTYSAEVTTTTYTGNTPTGTVAFTDGSIPLCTTATLSGSGGGPGVGQCNATNAPVGNDTITATYAGVTGQFFSTGGSVGTTTLTVSAPTPTATFTAEPAGRRSLSLGPMSHRPPSP